MLDCLRPFQLNPLLEVAEQRRPVGTDAPFDVQVPAGGLCATVDNIVDGTNVHVAEQPSTSYRIVSVACNPGCKNIDLTGGSVDITVGRGVEKSVHLHEREHVGVPPRPSTLSEPLTKRE